MFRLHPMTFMKLRDELIERDLIRDSRYVTATEQLGIFMYAMGHGVASGATCEHFQHSSDTISKHVRKVTKALASLHFTYIKLPSLTDPVHPRIRHDDRFYPSFKDAIGAIDGTHVPAHILRERKHGGREDEDNEPEEDPNLSVSTSDMTAGEALRDAIATQLWMAT
ncbi:hypothetical protein Taro_010790 [Colocasia esculenta]|uniref:DUF8040 domain-containing protein n=1 Tax=Colocasia esculenta TaxID=4460 RepID=A0A843U8H3_COLES|nr:hypothetical protein [Colocasia esculenta]